MEQYWMPKKLDYQNIKKCLNSFKAERLFIRLVGSMGGTVKVNENLEGKILDIKKVSGQFSILINKREVFLFPLKTYYKGFSLAYERIDKRGVMVMLSTGIDPDDPNLPKPRRSMLRNVLDDHLIEIRFHGKIPLKFHSYWGDENEWKLWYVDVEKNRADLKFFFKNLGTKTKGEG